MAVNPPVATTSIWQLINTLGVKTMNHEAHSWEKAMVGAVASRESVNPAARQFKANISDEALQMDVQYLFHPQFSISASHATPTIISP